MKNQDFKTWSFNLEYEIQMQLLEEFSLNSSVKKVFLEISQNSKARNFIKKETLTQVFSCEFFKISKITFPYRTPPVAGSVNNSLACETDCF